MEYVPSPQPSSSLNTRYVRDVLSSLTRANRVNQSREQWAQIKIEDNEMELVTKLAELAEHRPLPTVPSTVCIVFFKANFLDPWNPKQTKFR